MGLRLCNGKTEGDSVTTDTTYNGWTNRETWLVGVWDFFDHDHVRQAIDNIISGDAGTDAEINADIVRISGLNRAVTVALAKWLENVHKDTLDEVMGLDKLAGYLQDHIDTSLWGINWIEIAKHYEAEIKEALTEVKGVPA
jgi:hypothetical protein